MNYANELKRQLLPHERKYLNLPNANLGLVARLKGKISEEQFREAIAKTKEKYVFLSSKISKDEKNDPWLVSDENIETLLKIIAKKSSDQWTQVFLEEHKKYFDFEKGPLIKFFLFSSPNYSEILVICHHSLSNLMGLSYLIKDVLYFMDNPKVVTDKIFHPAIVIPQNFPDNVHGSLFVKNAMKIINGRWKKDEIFFDTEDFHNIHKAYWKNNSYDVIVKEFSESETRSFVDLCHKNQVSITSFLSAIFLKGRGSVLNDTKKRKIMITVDLKNRLTKKYDYYFGDYGGDIYLDFRYDSNKTIWKNASNLQKKLRTKLTRNNEFNTIINQRYTAPSLIDVTAFALLGNLIDSSYSRYEKIHNFSNKKSIIKYYFKKLKSVFPVQVMANIGKLDFPAKYSSFELDRLIPLPFVSSNVDIIIGVQTVGDKMTLTLNYMEETVDRSTVEEILNESLEL